MKKILIAGGSGLVGQALRSALSEHYQIFTLSRSSKSAPHRFRWNIEDGYIDSKALEVDVIINLAGAGIVDKPWSDLRKKVLRESRIGGNRLLFEELKRADRRPSLFIGASAIGFYGDRPGETLNEESEAGAASFLVDLCRDWESSINEFSSIGVRTCTVRIGLVLSQNGGIVPQLLKTMPLGVGTYFGSGETQVSWIHIHDLCSMIEWMLKDESISGVFNATAPEPVNFKSFTHHLLTLKGGLKWCLPAPEFFLRLIMGERTDAILQDAKVLPERAGEAGFTFQYEDLAGALSNL